MRQTRRKMVIALFTAGGLCLSLPLLDAAAGVPDRLPSRTSPPIDVRARRADAWSGSGQSDSDRLIAVIRQEISKSYQSISIESSYRKVTRGRHETLVASVKATQGGILVRGLIPTDDPEDGRAHLLEGSAEYEFRPTRHLSMRLAGRLTYDTVFETIDLLPAATLEARLAPVRVSAQIAQNASPPWVGSHIGEYTFRSAILSVENLEVQSLGYAVEAAWTTGCPAGQGRGQDALPFAGDTGSRIEGTFEFGLTRRIALAAGARIAKGYALRLVESSTERPIHTRTDAAVRFRPLWPVEGVQVEAVVQNLVGTAIPEFGGLRGHGRSGTIRISFSRP